MGADVELCPGAPYHLYNAGSGIDIWRGAGAPAHSSKRFRSLHPVSRAAH
jgi:hypothetical protein